MLSVHTKWMKVALGEAEIALRNMEVPVGAVFVVHPVLSDGSVNFAEGTVISRGHNTTNADRNATKHAEFVALHSLLDITTLDCPGLVLYVTCEPCIMCSYALLLAGVVDVVFGCSNPRFGGCGSVLPVHTEAKKLNCIKGVMEKEAIDIMKQFYGQENPNAPEEKRVPKQKKIHQDISL